METHTAECLSFIVRLRICPQINCQKCTGVEISIGKVVVGKTIGVLIHGGTVAKMTSHVAQTTTHC